MDRDMVLEQLTALDFMAVDLGLYLNTHPMDAVAIGEYNKIIKAADMLRAKYEENFGPLCSFRSVARNSEMWTWNECPWPWDKSANFQIEEGCR